MYHSFIMRWTLLPYSISYTLANSSIYHSHTYHLRGSLQKLRGLFIHIPSVEPATRKLLRVVVNHSFQGGFEKWASGQGDYLFVLRDLEFSHPFRSEVRLQSRFSYVAWSVSKAACKGLVGLWALRQEELRVRYLGNHRLPSIGWIVFYCKQNHSFTKASSKLVLTAESCRSDLSSAWSSPLECYDTYRLY
jgi:hypothetical protein